MKIIFFGSDDFAVAHLEQLIRSQHELLACVTRPDRAQGRGLKLAASPVKEWAVENHIPVLEPVNLKDMEFVKTLRTFNCDLFIVIAFGKILPADLLFLPYLCSMNVHASLLPSYRGAAPINWAVIKGEKDTGVSIIKMSAELDAGDIFDQLKITIEEGDDAIRLKKKMGQLSPPFLLKTITAMELNKYTLTLQDKSLVTYAPKLTKELGEISWRRPAGEIQNLIRGLVPWPTAYTHYQGKILKILETSVFEQSSDSYQPGQIIEIKKDGFVVAAEQGALLVKKIHRESSKPMDAASFLAGHQLKVGDQLG